MYRSKGEIERLLDMRDLDLPGNATLPLSDCQRKLIEDTTVLGTVEKLELILVSLGVKLTTEIAGKIPYYFNAQKQKELPDSEFIRRIDRFLQKLSFPYYHDSIEKTIRKTGHKRELHWFQVSVNKRVSYFMRNYADSLTEMENGILYGYPLSAIRAYSTLIDAEHNHSSPAERFLAGVGSKNYRVEEHKAFQVWWDRIKEISPKLIREAEKELSSSQANPFSIQSTRK